MKIKPERRARRRGKRAWNEPSERDEAKAARRQ